MQLVINISEDIYRRLKNGDTNAGNTLHNTALESISNGVVLPKGHGRLIDVDALELPSEEMVSRLIINYAKTIIEADKEE